MEDFEAALAYEENASVLEESDNEDGFWSFDDTQDVGGEAQEPAVVADEAASRSRKRKARDDEEELAIRLGADMAISEQEREWALALKEHLQECDIMPMSDMELVQYAILEQGNLEKAKVRIQKIQEFRKNYQIEDTVRQGVQSIKDVMEQQPGFFLHIGRCSRQEKYVQVLDFAKLDPQKVHLETDWKVTLSGMYYALSSLNPTLSAVRNGHLAIMECDGMGWHNFSVDLERRLWHEFASAFPARFHEVSWVRTPLIANVFFALLKPILPKEVCNAVHLGVQFDESFEGRLDALFLQPSPEIANMRQVMTVEDFLTLRYHNQKYFKL